MANILFDRNSVGTTKKLPPAAWHDKFARQHFALPSLVLAQLHFLPVCTYIYIYENIFHTL